jgi:hypothetical protein
MASLFQKISLFTCLIISTAFIAPMVLHAQNDLFLYTINTTPTPTVFTWIEPATVTPISTTCGGVCFQIAGVSGDPSGAGAGSYLQFINGKGNGMEPFNGTSITNNFVLSSLTNNKLFNVPITSPTFIIGSYPGTVGGITATLVISAIATPEPSTYLTLAGCLAIGALAAAKRRKVSV